MKKVFKSKKGITLVALVITVIVMLILAGVAISVILDGEGLFSRTRQAAEEYEQAAKYENTQLQSLMDEIDRYLDGVPSTPGDGTGDGNETPTPEGPIATEVLEKMTNGSWDEEKQIHTPKVVDGMSVIYWDENGVEQELTENNTETEWNNWYNYTEQTGSTATAGSGTSKWANAVTKNNGADNIAGNEDDQITGYWVWIPRYEYKLTAPPDGAEAGTIDVNFIQIGESTTADYKLHPAFSNDTAAGGWDSDIPGFWVAKYPAGFQKSTVAANSISSTTTIDTIILANGDNTVEWSTEKYTTPGADYTNALGQVLTTSNITAAGDDVKISYPVFNPLTYAYNAINIDSAFRISHQIGSATSFYGLSNVDSHLMKNSEWGAVAYLTWSQYGRNGTEPNINNVSLEGTTNTIYAVTGIYANGTETASTAGIFNGNVYNTTIGQLGSSTGNITGVYDLNGCVWERVTGYIENTAGEAGRNRYGASIIASTTAEKYRMIYESGDESKAEDGDDSDITLDNEKRQINFDVYANGEKTYYGDAVLETSTLGAGRASWNGDYSCFPFGGGPFFVRGGSYGNEIGSGIFAFYNIAGNANTSNGFRTALVGIV